MKNIKKNNAGSTFIIVLIVIALFIMLVSIFSMQINNQIQSSNKHHENQERKYLAESGIEKTIADISNEIEVGINGVNVTEMEVEYNSTESKTNVIKDYFDNCDAYIVKAISYLKPKSIIVGDLTNIQNGLKKIKEYNDFKMIWDDSFKKLSEIKSSYLKSANNDFTGGNKGLFKEELLKCENELYKVLTSIYLQRQYHEGHQVVKLEMNEIRNLANNIVSNNIYNGNLGLGQIYNDLYNLNLGNGGLKLQNILYSRINTLRNDTWNKLGSGGDSLIFKLSDFVHYNNIKDINDPRYKNKTDEIGKYIDLKIQEILNIQLALDRVYLENGNKADDLSIKIIEIQKKLESVKYNLIELKCRLGIEAFNAPDDNEDSGVEILLNISPYKYPNETMYKTNGYEREGLSIPIKVNYKNGEIVSINPSKVKLQGIKSTGYKNAKEYKIEANITFNIGKSNGKYKVISYDIDKWQRYE